MIRVYESPARRDAKAGLSVRAFMNYSFSQPGASKVAAFEWQAP